MIFKENREVSLSFLTILVLGTVYMIFSNGFYPIDEAMHYYYNRHFFEIKPVFAAGAWHRLGRMMLYTPPAMLGHWAVMLTGFTIYIFTAILTLKIAKKITTLNPYPVVLLVGLQPVFFDISYSAMAEGPATFLITLSLYLYLRKNYTFSMLFASLVFLFRTEMMLYAGLLALLFVYEKRYLPLLAIIVGPFIWWAYGYYFSGNPLFLYNELKNFSKFPKYKEGVEIYYYIVFAPVIFGVITTLLFGFGVKVFKDIENKNFMYLVFSTIITTVVLNTIYALKYVHISGSCGDLRYLTPISPMVALVSLFGYYEFKEYLNKKGKNTEKYYLWIPVLLLLNVLVQIRPHRLTDIDEVIKENTLKAREMLKPGEKIYSNSAISFFVLNTPHENKGIIERYNIEKLVKGKKGYFLWDSFSCDNVLDKRRFKAEDIKKIPGVTMLDSNYVDEEYHYLFKKE